ncbi:MAG: nucleotidyltransferase family protein, partial [Clostridia bacterium]|nr:nucleotidyltransferase family protein [Clostridia bacterium]
MSLSNITDNLTIEEKYLISVLSAALKSKNAEAFAKELDQKSFCKLCADQCVAPLAYIALKETGLSANANAVLKDFYDKAVLLSAKQDAEAERIFAAFSKNKIRFVPLKGIVVRRLYAHPECRTMSDIDIYIDEKDFPRAKKAMQSLGFEYKGRLSYQHQFECGGVSVELHFALWGYGFEKISGFESLFDFAENTSGTEYRLRPEFNYVFLTAHIAKHLKTSGIGVRAFLDIYLYSLKFGKTMDWGLINKYLVEMGLDRFAVRIRDLIGAWFYSKPFDDNVRTMTKYIILSYTHGTRTNEAAASLTDGTSKTGKKISLLFPSMSYMKRRFLILNKMPFLYPFCWLVRLVTAPFSKKSSSSGDISALGSISEKDVENVSSARKAFGLAHGAEIALSNDGRALADRKKPKIDFESEEAEEHKRRTFTLAGVAVLML